MIAEEESARQKQRVLVADDVRVVVQKITWALEEAGFEVASAHDGEECLERAASFAPQVLVLDLMMPKVHGIEVLRRLKADPATRHIEVVVCTAKDFRTEIERAQELGAADLVIKPFDTRELVAKVEELSSGRRPGRRIEPVQRGELPYATGEAFQPSLETAGGCLRFWGTRGSIPISGPQCIRHGGNTCCMSLDFQGETIIFDAGSGIRELGMALAAGAPRRIHLFITHTHWDHIQGFPFFAPAFTPGFEIVIYGAKGFNKNLESLLSGQLDPDYFPIQMHNMDARLEFRYLGDRPVSIGDARISWEFTQHPGPTLGYKIELPGKCLAFVPDNEAFQGYMGAPEAIGRETELLAVYQPILDFLREVDVLIHEAQYTPEEYCQTVRFGHSSVTNACALVKLCAARRWLIIHHDPGHSDDFLLEKLNLTRQLLARLEYPIPVTDTYDRMLEVL